MKAWITATGGHERSEQDLPCIKIFAPIDNREFEDWVDKQIVEDLIQFYPRDAIGYTDMYSGPELQPVDRVRELFAAIDEDEDTLFTKVEDARAELLQLVMFHIIQKDEGWEHQTFMGSDSAGYATVQLVELP